MNRNQPLALLVLANVARCLIVRDRHGIGRPSSLARLGEGARCAQRQVRRLRLEQATWAESNRIDQVMQQQLGMAFPRTKTWWCRGDEDFGMRHRWFWR